MGHKLLFLKKFILSSFGQSLCVLIVCIHAAFPSSMRRALLWRAVSSRGCAFWGIKQPNKRGLASNAAPSLNFPRLAQITSSPFLAPVAPKCQRWRPESDVEGAPLRRDWLSCSEAAVGAQRQRLRGGTCSEWAGDAARRNTTIPERQVATTAPFQRYEREIPPRTQRSQGKDLFRRVSAAAGWPGSGRKPPSRWLPERGCFCRKWRHRPLVSAWPRRGEE